MYKVIVKGKNTHFHETIDDFKNRKEAQIFIKECKMRDKEFYNILGLYYKYKIVKIK